METERVRVRSVQTRMVWSYLLLIVLVVSVLGAAFATLMWNYYYGSAKSSVVQRVESAISLHSRSLSSLTLQDQADYMLQYMVESGSTRIQLLNSEGEIRIDSDGFSPNIRYSTGDVKAAMNGSTGSWTGEDPYFGERVISVTMPLWNDSRVVSMLRYTSSLERVDSMVQKIIQMATFVGFAVILLFLGLSIFLAQRIVKPIQELTRAARYMAEGDWSRRANKRGDDEIGQLAETFNAMVSELNKREKLKNDFISSISHELRTPLTSIKGWSETLKESEPTEDDEEVKLGLSIISKETERLSGLVEDLLDFSKLSARTMELHTEMLDLNGPVKETVHQLAVREEGTRVRLLATFGVGPILIQGDANRIKQVIINLIDNAFKFTAAGGTVRVTTSVISDKAVVIVSDTGSGIDEDDLPHVMDKFYKSSNSYGGSGLGLAICKDIVELHGGEITIDSERGVGTIVKVTLPILYKTEVCD
ncbi:HAMP domain-containing histidine kinase [Paenibacillus sp. GSMTC-2017]|uniref:sensor histidine kinase n=1 Tax=Paenibacillus sp. GSMTC-2017 TaxID=2794350 RepID=UPI0018D5FF59|nr:HAMP domain-containing sensor histidine kinase [Paenibacillus sp. GSMTC-2017]MBH5319012.1 HAMP domain-containing histidine kinase [Paenibacillus sp. GSMTC-2017]